MTLASTAMLQTGLWHPAVLATVLCAATVPMHVFGLITAMRELPARGPVQFPTVPLVLVLAVVGAAICAVAALSHRHLDPGT
ncbi:hypothetical protein ACWKSP_30010 [Micromonosporaceae bacterium Da 78-11]